MGETMLDPHGRVILISGANRGIGLAVAQALYAKGYTVSLGVRDPSGLEGITAHWNELRLHTAHYEAAQWKTHAAWIESVVERFGRLDGLVANAGIGSRGSIRTIEEAELDSIWAVNCKAPLNLIRHALPHLEASGAGRIVNIASLSGKRGAQRQRRLQHVEIRRHGADALGAPPRLGEGRARHRALPLLRAHRHDGRATTRSRPR